MEESKEQTFSEDDLLKFLEDLFVGKGMKPVWSYTPGIGWIHWTTATDVEKAYYYGWMAAMKYQREKKNGSDGNDDPSSTPEPK